MIHPLSALLEQVKYDFKQPRKDTCAYNCLTFFLQETGEEITSLKYTRPWDL